MKTKNLILLSAFIVSTLGFAQAKTITYTDAVQGASGNTFATGGSLSDTTWLDTTTNSSALNNTEWQLRTPFGNDGTVFQGLINDATNFPELTTQVTGVSDGTYTVWAFFWDDSAAVQQWSIDAGLTSGALTHYEIGDATAASTLTFSTSVMTTESTRTMYGANLGTVTIAGGLNITQGTGNNTINIFVDDTNAGSSEDRVWYDGVGIAIPEPSSFAFLTAGLAGLLTLRRRRARR